MQKTSSINEPVIPFVMSHFISTDNYNNLEKCAAETDDIISLVAPVAVNIALQKHSNVEQSMLKIAGNVEFNEKLAAFGDTVANVGTTLLNGIIFKGRGQSLASSLAGNAIDNALIDRTMK